MRRLFSLVMLTTLIIGINSGYAGPLQKSVTSININQAELKQLVTLKGVGKKRAQAIIAYRQAHGKFHTVEDLLAVPGMSKKILDKVAQKNQSQLVAQ